MKSKFNRFNLLTICLTFVIVCLGISSCGDDDDDNGTAKTDVGVNVVKGRKLIELNIDSAIVFKVQYDSKGRMDKILRNRNSLDRVKEKDSIKEEFIVIMEIDYDLRVFTIYDWDYNYSSWRNEYHPYSFGFALNEDGFISLLGNNVLKYDSNGYLESVDSPEGLSTLSFNNDGYFKASISSMKAGQMKLYYATFGDRNKKGELYVSVSSTSQEKFLLIGHPETFGYNRVLCLIAYQAGLFGKVSEGCFHFKDAKDASMFFDEAFLYFGGESSWNFKTGSKIYFEFE